MKKTHAFLLILLTAMLFSCRKDDFTGKDLTILTENLKPYNFSENGTAKGITYDLAQEILSRFELDNAIEMGASWDQLLNRLKTEENIALFTTMMTTERKDLFKWAGPVVLAAFSFVGLPSEGFTINDVEDAKKLNSVGVPKSFSTAELLHQLGFTNLVEYSDEDAMVRGLYQGEVQVIFDDFNIVKMTAVSQGRDIVYLAPFFTYSTQQGFIAFSKDVDDQIVAKWQDAINDIKDEGLLQEILDRYVPDARAPGRVNLFTEENPPLSFTGTSGALSGSSVEMVNAMMEIMGMDYPVNMTAWADAIAQVHLVPNSAAFSTLRSPSRESLFKWVGPIAKNRFRFFVRAGSDIHINTLDDARVLGSVATVNGWASNEELITRGFTNVVTYTAAMDVIRKLMQGDVDCAVLNEVGITYKLTEAGFTPADVRKEAVLMEGLNYLAFSIDTDDSYITQWNNAYNQMVSSGRLAQIWGKWFPDIDW
ncbi:MAG: transporter substrate-binding domain-containing protein [Bacteroidia bacterium]|nr:transporter substrate-binding domain-containing protein [Bacteroidia bacterium]